MGINILYSTLRRAQDIYLKIHFTRPSNVQGELCGVRDHDAGDFWIEQWLVRDPIFEPHSVRTKGYRAIIQGQWPSLLVRRRVHHRGLNNGVVVRNRATDQPYRSSVLKPRPNRGKKTISLRTIHYRTALWTIHFSLKRKISFSDKNRYFFFRDMYKKLAEFLWFH